MSLHRTFRSNQWLRTARLTWLPSQETQLCDSPLHSVRAAVEFATNLLLFDSLAKRFLPIVNNRWQRGLIPIIKFHFGFQIIPSYFLHYPFPIHRRVNVGSDCREEGSRYTILRYSLCVDFLHQLLHLQTV